MKIVNVAPHLTIPGDRGGSIHQFSLSRALVQQGAEVHLVCQVNREILPTGRGICDGVHFHDVAGLSSSHIAVPFYTLAGLKKTVRVCRKENIDIVHDRAYLLGGGGTFAGKICNKPVGIQLDEFWLASYQRIYGQSSPFIRSRPFTIVNLQWLNLFLRLGDVLLPVSDDLGKTINRVFQIPATKIQTITNGVNTSQFTPMPKQLAMKRLTEDLSKKMVGAERIVGFMGEVAPWQGVKTFIDAAQIVLNRFPKTMFLIIGGLKTNETRRDLLNKITKKIETKGLKDKIIITGQQPHEKMPLFLSLCDILTAPFSEVGYKWSYGFSPLKIFEYLAMGKPVIATDLPWIKELINSKNGIIVPPANSKALAEAICELINKPRKIKKLGSNARRQAEEKLDWTVIAKQLLQIYAKML